MVERYLVGLPDRQLDAALCELVRAVNSARFSAAQGVLRDAVAAHDAGERTIEDETLARIVDASETRLPLAKARVLTIAAACAHARLERGKATGVDTEQANRLGVARQALARRALEIVTPMVVLEGWAGVEARLLAGHALGLVDKHEEAQTQYAFARDQLRVAPGLGELRRYYEAELALGRVRNAAARGGTRAALGMLASVEQSEWATNEDVFALHARVLIAESRARLASARDAIDYPPGGHSVDVLFDEVLGLRDLAASVQDDQPADAIERQWRALALSKVEACKPLLWFDADAESDWEDDKFPAIALAAGLGPAPLPPSFEGSSYVFNMVLDTRLLRALMPKLQREKFGSDEAYAESVLRVARSRTRYAGTRVQPAYSHRLQQFEDGLGSPMLMLSAIDRVRAAGPLDTQRDDAIRLSAKVALFIANEDTPEMYNVSLATLESLIDAYPAHADRSAWQAGLANVFVRHARHEDVIGTPAALTLHRRALDAAHAIDATEESLKRDQYELCARAAGDALEHAMQMRSGDAGDAAHTDDHAERYAQMIIEAYEAVRLLGGARPDTMGGAVLSAFVYTGATHRAQDAHERFEAWQGETDWLGERLTYARGELRLCAALGDWEQAAAASQTLMRYDQREAQRVCAQIGGPIAARVDALGGLFLHDAALDERARDGLEHDARALAWWNACLDQSRGLTDEGLHNNRRARAHAAYARAALMLGRPEDASVSIAALDRHGLGVPATLRAEAHLAAGQDVEAFGVLRTIAEDAAPGTSAWWYAWTRMLGVLDRQNQNDERTATIARELRRLTSEPDYDARSAAGVRLEALRDRYGVE